MLYRFLRDLNNWLDNDSNDILGLQLDAADVAGYQCQENERTAKSSLQLRAPRRMTTWTRKRKGIHKMKSVLESGLNGLAVGIRYTELQTATVMIEVLQFNLVPSLAHRMLSGKFARTMLSIVVHHLLPVKIEVAAIVRKKREGIDGSFGNIDISRDDQPDVTFCSIRNSRGINGIVPLERCCRDSGTVGSTIVIPPGLQTTGCGIYIDSRRIVLADKAESVDISLVTVLAKGAESEIRTLADGERLCGTYDISRILCPRLPFFCPLGIPGHQRS